MEFWFARATIKQWDFLANIPALAMTRQLDALANIPALAMTRQLDALANIPALAMTRQLDALANIPALAMTRQLDALANIPALAMTRQLDALANIPALAIARQLSALADPAFAMAHIGSRYASSQTEANGPLDRDQARLIVGMFCYIVVWLIVLQILLDVANDTGITPAVTGFAVTMTGCSGHAVAMHARKVCLWAFD